MTQRDLINNIRKDSRGITLLYVEDNEALRGESTSSISKLL